MTRCRLREDHGRCTLTAAGINILQYFPGLRSYYQGLSVHGVANALVLTFAFANGFLPLLTARALSRPLRSGLLHATFWTLLAGAVLAGWALVTNRASVLYTSYAPLQAHWTYYLGLVLIVVSTWLASANMFLMLRDWRHAGLAGMPRRTFMAEAAYRPESWGLAGTLTGIGGTMMVASVLMFFVVMAMTLLVGTKGGQPEDIPVSETLTAPARTGWEPSLDRLGLWMLAAVALVVIAYGPFFLASLPPHLVSPGFRIW